LSTDPKWTDLPELRFKSSLKEILKESIVLHVTHHGKLTNTTLGRCNLLFRTLVDNGKTFKDEDLVSFKGPLKVDNAEIQGTLTFKFLPRFAQMKPVNIVRKAIHTEKGIFDAAPLITGLPQPHCPIVMTQEVQNENKSCALSCSTSKLPEKPKKEKKDKRGSIKETVDDVKEPEPTKNNRNSTVTYEEVSPAKTIEKDNLFPHAEDKHSASPRVLRKPIERNAPNDLISFSPMNARKIQSAPNLREFMDPFHDLLAQPYENPFTAAPDAITPTFDPFKEHRLTTTNNPFAVR